MIKIILAILIFSAIVLFHELGHFLLAKKNGVCVVEFAIGLGPTIIGKQWGETKYSIKCLPFGGCCMMLGEDGEDEDPRAFNNQSARARFQVIFAGPFFNFIMAFMMALVVIGMDGADPAMVGEVDEGSGAMEAGLQEGDRIIKINGSRIYNFREISLFNYLHQENPEITVTYERDGNIEETSLTRKKNDQGSLILGVIMTDETKQSVFGVMKYSLLEIRYQVKSTILSLKYLFSGRAALTDMSGPVGIVNMIGETYEQSVLYGIRVVVLSMLSFAIMLNANLGVMNLLPLPALDGGRLVFILIEMIVGKKVPPDKEGLIHFGGIVVLMGLMIFIMANDIRNIFLG